MFEHFSILYLLSTGLIVLLCGLVKLRIKEEARYRRLRLALKDAKSKERAEIIAAMAEIEARWSWRLGRIPKPPRPSPPAPDHDSSSA